MSILLLLAALILANGLPSDGAPAAPLAAKFGRIAADAVKGCDRPVPEAEDALERTGRAAFDHWAGTARQAETVSPR